MFIKINYAPDTYKYILDLKEITFISQFSDNAYKYSSSSEENQNILISESFLTKEIGCSRFGNGSNDWYLNTIKLTLKDGTDKLIYFCGIAYLCDNTGRTIDTLR